MQYWFLLFLIAEPLYISMNLSIVDGLKKLHRFAFYMLSYSGIFEFIHNDYLNLFSNKIFFKLYNIRSQLRLLTKTEFTRRSTREQVDKNLVPRLFTS